MIDNWIYGYVFVVGACVGSFLNVCIYRLPVRKSVIRPRSACPKCGQIIRWYDNIPIFSYLWLKAKCRHCGVSIAPRYATVELMTAALALGTFIKFGMSWETFIYFFFISCLIVITFIDIDHQIIPDRITLPGIPLFFFLSLLIPSIRIIDSLLGIILGGASLYLVIRTYRLLTGREGMGFGDVKLLAMIGGLIGWKGVLFTIFISSAVGTAVGVIVMLYQRKSLKLAIPYGPFLAIGAIAYIFWGKVLTNWYFYEVFPIF